jgi:hypothetical protein
MEEYDERTQQDIAHQDCLGLAFISVLLLLTLPPGFFPSTSPATPLLLG